MTSSMLFSIITFIYFLSMFLYLCYFAFRSRVMGLVASSVTISGLVIHTMAFFLRWVESYRIGAGHAPMSNMYESLVFFAWCIVLIYLILEIRYKARTMGVFVTPFAFLSMAYASLSPNVSDRIEPLIPALQSNWLIGHVLTCFLGYAGFAVSCGVSVMYLIRIRTEGKYSSGPGIVGYLPNSKLLDDLSYKSIAIGFFMLTLGIVTGAAWANSAWGTYWSWDPKETWSLITWFVYAAFLHARVTRGWRGKRAAVLSIFGFIAVLFTYFGVNYLLSGLHSYA